MRRKPLLQIELRNTWFMPLRLVVFLVVFGSIVISLRSHLELYGPFFAYCSITLLFLISMLFARRAAFAVVSKYLIALQLLSELTIEAFMVYYSGSLSSPFSGLFVLTIVSASLAYRLVGTLSMATFASLAYSMAIWVGIDSTPLSAFSIEAFRDLYNANDDLFYTVFSHLCIFYLAAFISGYLAERIRAKDQELFRASEKLKRAHLETDEILQHLHSGLITIDNMGKIVFFNWAAEKITGLKETEIKGKNCLEVFRDRMPHFAEKILAVLKSSQHDIRTEITLAGPDGTEIPIGMSSSILGDERFGVRGVVAVFQDLTEAKKTEKRIRSADRLAAVGELAASIAHEIRNPLTAISGSVEVLSNELNCEGENERLMNLILKESSRLNHILVEFLDYARVKRPTFAKVEINHLILDLFDIVRHHESYHDRIALEHVSATTTEYISGDEEMFKQFVLNILVNAVEAIGDKKGKVTVEIKRAVDSPVSSDLSEFEWVNLTVSDNGPGLSDTQKKMMFEPFFSTKKDGTGLGLSIVKRIVDNLGGRIEVEASRHTGAKFTILLKRYIEGLPQKKAAQQHDEQPSTRPTFTDCAPR
jgi:two-component system sensor histidine kinase PilS (NtrC family)